MWGYIIMNNDVLKVASTTVGVSDSLVVSDISSEEDHKLGLADVLLKWGVYVGSDSSRIVSSMLPFTQGVVRNADGKFQVLWDIGKVEAARSSFLGGLKEHVSGDFSVIVVCTDDEMLKLVNPMLESVPGVQLITRKWVSGMVSNKGSLRRSAEQHLKKDQETMGKRDLRRFDKVVQPLRDYLRSSSRPKLVLFLNPYDTIEALVEVRKQGILVASLCDSESYWVDQVDYPIPFPSLSTFKLNSRSGKVGDSGVPDHALIPLMARLMFMRVTRDSVVGGSLEGSDESSDVILSVGDELSGDLSDKGSSESVSSDNIVDK